MENIAIKDLQNLANIVANEGNVSLKNQLSAWVTAKAGNSDHVALSSLAGLAHYSSVKEQILIWISSVTNPKPEFVYVPDIPAQIIEQPEIEPESTGEPEIIPEEVILETPLSEVLPSDEPEPVVEKPKRTRKKKDD